LVVVEPGILILQQAVNIHERISTIARLLNEIYKASVLLKSPKIWISSYPELGVGYLHIACVNARCMAKEVASAYDSSTEP
jgi:hypothetical protein